MSSVAGVDESKSDLPCSHERDRSERAEQDFRKLKKSIGSLRIFKTEPSDMLPATKATIRS
jgi:hypothetical protein